MHAWYRLVMTPSPVADDLHLSRSRAVTKTEEQASAALPGGWAACHVVHESTGETVGMRRLLGDGGWYFHVIDMAVLTAHQRRGLGDAILKALIDQIRELAPAGTYVTLPADPPGRRLYERHGFTETAPGSVGMATNLNGP